MLDLLLIKHNQDKTQQCLQCSAILSNTDYTLQCSAQQSLAQQSSAQQSSAQKLSAQQPSAQCNAPQYSVILITINYDYECKIAEYREYRRYYRV